MKFPVSMLLVAASLVAPAVAVAQQGWPQWPIPGLPNPFQPPPGASGAPAVPTMPTLPGFPTAPPTQLAGTPVVFELFTSMDCAACESAEYEVQRLLEQPVAGARLIPIAYHVEFYGGGRTTDPYVLPAATSRQQAYDAARGRVYTPQAIVDGDREFTGSEDGTARTAIAAAARQSKVGVEVGRSARIVGPSALALSIRYGAGNRRGETLTVVLSESGLLELHHGGQTEYDRVHLAPVVRSVQSLGGASPSGGSTEATVAIPPGTVRANLTAVVMLEETGSHHVLGVGTLGAGPM